MKSRDELEQELFEAERENRIVRRPIRLKFQIVLAILSFSSSLAFAPLALYAGIGDIEYRFIVAFSLCLLGIVVGVAAFFLSRYSWKRADYVGKKRIMFCEASKVILTIEIAFSIIMALYIWCVLKKLMDILPYISGFYGIY